MYPADGEAFSKILNHLVGVFGKDLTDDQRTWYWEALKDQPLQSVKEHADRHARFGKFFPKPFELRPKDDKPRVSDARLEAAFAEAQKRSADNLEELRRSNPEAWAREVRLRKLDRILATEPPHTVVYAEALKMWHQMRETKT